MGWVVTSSVFLTCACEVFGRSVYCTFKMVGVEVRAPLESPKGKRKCGKPGNGAQWGSTPCGKLLWPLPKPGCPTSESGYLGVALNWKCPLFLPWE